MSGAAAVRSGARALGLLAACAGAALAGAAADARAESRPIVAQATTGPSITRPLAASGRWVLSARDPQAAGQPLQVEVLVLNETDRPLVDPLPARLPARIVQGPVRVDATLERVAAAAPPAADTPLGPGQFRRAPYTVQVPSGVSGLASLELAGAREGQVLFVAVPRGAAPAIAPIARDSGAGSSAAAITAPGVVPAPAAAVAAEAGTSTASGLRLPGSGEVPTSTGTTLADRNEAAALAALSTHEPMYAALGLRESSSIKFQLSMKYRLLDEDTWLGQRVRPLSRIHLGYTQTSIWDIGRESSPFRDTSYRPSVFYFDPSVWRSPASGHNLSLSTGLEHESNGKDGVQSRSMNIVFVRPRLRYGLGGDYFLRLDPKLYYYLERSDNADIQRYRGWGDYAIGVGRGDDWLVNTTLRVGTGGYGSVQVDASWRLRQRIFANASGFFFAQYFHGYGESLIDYNVKRTSQLRLGFAIVR